MMKYLRVTNMLNWCQLGCSRNKNYSNKPLIKLRLKLRYWLRLFNWGIKI